MEVLPQSQLQRLAELSQHLNWPLNRLEVNDFGQMRLPGDPPTEEQKTIYPSIDEFGPNGDYVYYKSADHPGTDNWGDINTLSWFLDLAHDWKQKCLSDSTLCTPEKNNCLRRCTPQVGDLGFVLPTKYNTRGERFLGHAGHDEGKCIDIRPFRTDDKLIQTIAHKPGYSRNLTQAFIAFARERGATNIMFRDWKLVTTLNSGVTEKEKRIIPAGGHHNHMHFCYE